MTTKIKAIVILVLSACIYNAQTFKTGDVVVGANYGIPNTAYFITKTAVKFFYDNADKNQTNDVVTFNVSGKGVYSARAEYALKENLGVGASLAYWSMRVGVEDHYFQNDPNTGVYSNYVDNFAFNFSALAIGARINYHFANEEKKERKIDPYIGGAFGITMYSVGLSFDSNLPGKIAPTNSFNFKSGVGTYFSGTFGLRYYPVKPIGLNFEAGWDKGALLMGGIVLKISTKK